MMLQEGNEDFLSMPYFVVCSFRPYVCITKAISIRSNLFFFLTDHVSHVGG